MAMRSATRSMAPPDRFSDGSLHVFRLHFGKLRKLLGFLVKALGGVPETHSRKRQNPREQCRQEDRQSGNRSCVFLEKVAQAMDC